MSSGVQKTLRLLTDTPNEAAVPVLIAALDGSQRAIQDGALEAILRRRRGAGPRMLLQRWGQLSERWKRQIAEHPRQIATAVRDALLSGDGHLCANGCEALLSIREYEWIPTLVTAIEEPNNPYKVMVAETLVCLCDLLREEISGPREQARFREPARIAQQVLPSLEGAVDRYEQHRCREVLEAFLMLASHENSVLKRILCEPRHPAYLVVSEVLGSSSRISVIRLILNLLELRLAPSLALQVVSHRGDLPFVKQLLKRFANTSTNQLQKNLRRVESICWLQSDTQVLAVLSELEQAAAIQLAMVSNIDRLQVFDVVRHLLCNGGTAARRAASAALAEFGGAEANDLVLEALHDVDSQVQANVVVQLRERGITGAISRLIQLLDSKHEVVAKAAQSCLSEFNFNRYITVFDMMEDDIRRSTGLLVKRIDDSAISQLAAELKSRPRTRRLRGMQVALAMDAVPQVEPLVIGMLQDPDHFIRAEAARTLAYCNSPITLQSLRSALTDRSVVVREAAEQSMRKLTESGRMTTAGSFAAAIRNADLNPMLQQQET